MRALAPQIRDAWSELAPRFGTYREFLWEVIPRPAKRPTRTERDARIALVEIARGVWFAEQARRQASHAGLR